MSIEKFIAQYLLCLPRYTLTFTEISDVLRQGGLENTPLQSLAMNLPVNLVEYLAPNSYYEKWHMAVSCNGFILDVGTEKCALWKILPPNIILANSSVVMF